VDLEQISEEKFSHLCQWISHSIISYEIQTSFPHIFCHGDDSIRDDIISTDLTEHCAAQLGWEATADQGLAWTVGYLSRTRTPDGSTMCDVRRALVKYHLSASTPGKVNTPEALLAAKSLSYLATDYHTPLIGAVAWAHHRRNVQYHTRAAEKMFSLRLDLRSIGISELKNRKPPPFDETKASFVSLLSGIDMATLKSKHHEWTFYGLGGPLPDPIVLAPVQKPDLFIL
jgi:hypothetical protein